MKRIFIRLMCYLCQIAFVLAMPAFIWLQTEKTPVSYLEREVLTPVVAPGQKLKVHIMARRNKVCDADVERWLVDGEKFEWSIESQQRPFDEDYVLEFKVPLGAAPGKAAYRAKVAWRCNFVQQWFPNVVTQDAIIFTIAPSPGQTMDPNKQGLWTEPQIFTDFARAEPSALE